jgi:hypothetical protein
MAKGRYIAAACNGYLEVLWTLLAPGADQIVRKPCPPLRASIPGRLLDDHWTLYTISLRNACHLCVFMCP